MAVKEKPEQAATLSLDQRIKSLTLDLRALERQLLFARVHVEPVEELSKAVDNLRNTIWALLNSADMAEHFTHAGRAGTVLTAHRIQRATTLCDLLTEEIDSGNVAVDTKGVVELRKALAIAYKKLNYLLKAEPESS